MLRSVDGSSRIICQLGWLYTGRSQKGSCSTQCSSPDGKVGHRRSTVLGLSKYPSRLTRVYKIITVGTAVCCPVPGLLLGKL